MRYHLSECERVVVAAVVIVLVRDVRRILFEVYMYMAIKEEFDKW